MNKQKIIIISIVIFFLGIQYIVKPFLRGRDATRAVITVLTLWMKGDAPTSYEYWVDPSATPPINKINHYNITEKIIENKKGRKQAAIKVQISLPSSETLPSGREWVFELIDTNAGWKIVGFRPAG